MNLFQIPNPYTFEISNNQIKINSIIFEVSKDIQKGINSKIIAKRFHKTIIEFTLESVMKASVLLA